MTDQRIALLLEYSGKNFHGSQLQEGVATVQQEIERAVAILARQPLRVHLSGRTDAGVHASGQVAHVDWPRAENSAELDLKDLDLKELAWRLNGIMRSDLAVVTMSFVRPDFHARFSARRREYVYRILNRPQRSALLKDTHLHVRQPLDLKAMSDAASRVLGRHDFSAFRSTNGEKSSPLCDVERCEILNLREGELEFWIAADHFVYNMVRIIVGTLIEVGLAKRDALSVSEALQKGDRNLAGPTAPPWGLTLSKVSYPDEFRLWELMNQEMR
ncbi:MAG: tRNA pseudouridine(38-40) synthase TruA [Cyanobacteria bacterium REEB67]|nr:tRNA pseudouridine(38-40) synthase TruA [Cyanobacteria bacterium REEB67]